ncbi:phosphatidate cytidylyltransferase [Wolbachia endosymbiont of Howardula sp.]|uniref:phosphatidate cytidylyltransferase n=1 Tax=Wolbachia endosymbiont of Howardula sp. TaxID=2916816 RepID=UPI00217CE8F7|nr:phosphatidate cytidylyltransferase [Wolbachia endosymbiont of Howardula sp.]UWI83078.1 phosphatidate cytidylyltransferase [Wolbachia endosymbiont of Howardula sp.]
MHSNLIVRIFSSIVMFFLLILATYWSDESFYIFICSIAVLSSFEWYQITKGSSILQVIALFCIAVPNASLISLYHSQNGKQILLWFIFTIWSIDISAYFIGKCFGGIRIFPTISPGKTCSGCLGAILAGIGCAMCGSIFFDLCSLTLSPIIGIIFAIIAQLGDFTESLIKRYYGVKDSGKLIPGHGGILDRVDSLIFTAPLIAMYVRYKYLIINI